MKSNVGRGFLLLCVLLLGSANLFGQATASATLEGAILDKTQAAVVGATVTLKNKETGATRTTSSNDIGSYRFDLLPGGIYQLRVNMRGFSVASAENVQALVGQTTTLNFTLSLGAITETVTVTSEPPIVDVEKTNVGLAITPNDIESMPLNGRDFANLAYLAPGASPVDSYDPTKNRIAIFAVNGSSGRNVNLTVNGIDNKDNTVGGPVMQFPLESIQEFLISTQRFSAANGRSEGAAVNVITKSGTNDYHGTLYFFDRNEIFNSLNYFEKKENGGNGEKSPYSRQQFGGAIGGPVRKDKDFLFFTLEREREATNIVTPGSGLAELQLVTSLGAQPAANIPT